MKIYLGKERMPGKKERKKKKSNNLQTFEVDASTWTKNREAFQPNGNNVNDIECCL